MCLVPVPDAVVAFGEDKDKGDGGINGDEEDDGEDIDRDSDVVDVAFTLSNLDEDGRNCLIAEELNTALIGRGFSFPGRNFALLNGKGEADLDVGIEKKLKGVF